MKLSDFSFTECMFSSNVLQAKCKPNKRNHTEWTHLNGGNRSWPARPAVRSRTSPSPGGRWWFCWRPSLRAHCYRLQGKMVKVNTSVQRHRSFSGNYISWTSLPKSWKNKPERKRILTKGGQRERKDAETESWRQILSDSRKEKSFLANQFMIRCFRII